MGTFMAQPDDDYHLAGIDAYNQWMHDEFMAADPQRLIGLYQMPAVDIDVSVAKLREAKAPRLPRRDHRRRTRAATRSFRDDDDPFWAAAEEEGIPVHIHVGLSQAGMRQQGIRQHGAREAWRGPAVPSPSCLTCRAWAAPSASASGFMSEFIYSGMFDRFPGLRLVAAETGAGWIPNLLEHMDDHWWRNRTWTESQLELLPSEYFRRNWLIDVHPRAVRGGGPALDRRRRT